MIAMDRSDVVDFPLKRPLLGKNMFFQFNQLKQDLTKEGITKSWCSSNHSLYSADYALWVA